MPKKTSLSDEEDFISPDYDGSVFDTSDEKENIIPDLPSAAAPKSKAKAKKLEMGGSSTSNTTKEKTTEKSEKRKMKNTRKKT